MQSIEPNKQHNAELIIAVFGSLLIVGSNSRNSDKKASKT